MQITIIGSTKGHGFSDVAYNYAVSLGEEIARRGHTLLYGPEITVESLPSVAAESAKKQNGIVVAVAIGRAGSLFFNQDVPTTTIFTDCSGGAGREVILVNSANVVISIGGGSGTLTEMSIAYMNHLPIIAMKGSGGWSDKLAGGYIDDRKKYIVEEALSATEAIDKAEKLFLDFQNTDNTKFV